MHSQSKRLRPRLTCDWIGVSEQMELIRLGFAYAVRHELDLDRSALGTRGGSNYDTGGLDPDGLMASTVAIYYADMRERLSRTARSKS